METVLGSWKGEGTSCDTFFQTMLLVHLKKGKKTKKCDLHMGW